MSNDDRHLGCVALIITGPFLLAAATALRGWVLSIIWGWFVVPLGVPAIGIVQAIGISALVTMLTYEGAAEDSLKQKDTADVIGLLFTRWFVLPLTYLAVCWLVRWVAS